GYENWNSDEDRSKLFRQVIRFLDDFLLVCPAISFGKQLATTKSSINNVFKFHFSRDPVNHWMKSCPVNYGSCHGDDLFYLFGIPFKTPEDFPDNEDRQISMKFIKMISQ